MEVLPLCSIEMFADRPKARRGAAFLIFDGNEKVNAKTKLSRLKWSVENTFKTTIEDWADGIETKNPLCHYRRIKIEGKYDCAVFEYKHHRLYGFFCQPKEGYSLCIFVAYLPMRQWDKEAEICMLCEGFRTSLDVRRAMESIFKEQKNEN